MWRRPAAVYAARGRGLHTRPTLPRLPLPPAPLLACLAAADPNSTCTADSASLVARSARPATGCVGAQPARHRQRPSVRSPVEGLPSRTHDTHDSCAHRPPAPARLSQGLGGARATGWARGWLGRRPGCAGGSPASPCAVLSRLAPAPPCQAEPSAAGSALRPRRPRAMSARSGRPSPGSACCRSCRAGDRRGGGSRMWGPRAAAATRPRTPWLASHAGRLALSRIPRLQPWPPPHRLGSPARPAHRSSRNSQPAAGRHAGQAGGGTCGGRLRPAGRRAARPCERHTSARPCGTAL
jgi:hypothetical protein